MNIDLFVFAEGTASDSRGALTLVGVNQRIISPEAMPFSTRQRIIMSFTDERAGSLGKEFDPLPDGELSIKVIDPSGRSRFAIAQPFKIPDVKTRADLPLIANIVSDLIISGDEYGVYMVEVFIKSTLGEEEARQFPIYVVAPQGTATAPESPASDR